jgi:hypothetical protein
VLLALCLNFSVAPAAASPDTAASIEEYVQQVSTNVHAVWPETHGVFRGADFQELVLVVTDFKRGWAITADTTHELTADELASVPKPVRTSGLIEMFDDWHGRSGMTFALPDDYFTSTADLLEPNYLATAAFAIASHELFHVHVQENWTAPATSDGTRLRGTHYPLDAEPRVMRYELFKALVNAYAEPQRRTEHLAAAAYWYKLWAAASGEIDQGLPTDLYEGTAEYFEAALSARAALGADASQEAYRQTLIRHLRIQIDPFWNAQLDSESYYIGLAAGLVAEELGTDWQAAAVLGTAPVTFLLQDVEPIEQEASQATLQRIEPQVNQQAERVGPKLEALIAAVNNPEQPLLVLPRGGMVGSFSPGEGFYHSSATADAQLIPNLSARFRTAAGTASLNGRPVAFGAAPCPLDASQAATGKAGRFILVPVSEDEIGTLESTVKILTSTLSASVHVEPVHDETGRMIFCATPPPG